MCVVKMSRIERMVPNGLLSVFGEHCLERGLVHYESFPTELLENV